MREQYSDMTRLWFRRHRREAPPSLPADRRRLVGAVERALQGRRRRRLLVRGAAATAVAAAAALVLVLELDPRLAAFPGMAPLAQRLFGHGAPADVQERALQVLSADSGGTGLVLVGATSHAIAPGMILDAGNDLLAPEAREVRVGTAEGTALTLEPGGRVTVSEAGNTQRFALRRGAVRARVAKLHVGERFLIDTADAEIEVHGTAFRVALAPADPGCAGGSRTRVSVSEGIVTVRWGGREERLVPGEQWPTGCPAPGGGQQPPEVRSPEPEVPPVAAASAAAPAVPVARAIAVRAPARAARPAMPTPVVAPLPSEAPPVAAATGAAAQAPAPAVSAPIIMPPASELAAQNDLFAAAVRAKRRGRPDDAIRLFTSLVRQHPQSPLVESAMAQRMKLLAARDPWQGAEAATQYLARFPGGFARAEARALATATAGP